MFDAFGYAAAIVLAAVALRRIPAEVRRWRLRRRRLTRAGGAERREPAPLLDGWRGPVGQFGNPDRANPGLGNAGGAGVTERLRRRLRSALIQAAAPVGESQAAVLWGVAAATGAVGGFVVASLPGAVAGAAGGLLGPPAALWTSRHRRRRLVVDALPDFLERVARSLRAGVSTVTALEEAAPPSGPLATDVGGVLADVRAGRSLAAALARWDEQCSAPEVALAAAALSIGAASGGRRAPAVDGVAATLRESRAAQREVASLAQQGRLSGLLIALLPACFLALSITVDAESTGVLYRTPLGLLCLAAGGALNIVAFVWMRRITRLR